MLKLGNECSTVCGPARREARAAGQWLCGDPTQGTLVDPTAKFTLPLPASPEVGVLGWHTTPSWHVQHMQQELLVAPCRDVGLFHSLTSHPHNNQVGCAKFAPVSLLHTLQCITLHYKHLAAESRVHLLQVVLLFYAVAPASLGTA